MHTTLLKRSLLLLVLLVFSSLSSFAAYQCASVFAEPGTLPGVRMPPLYSDSSGKSYYHFNDGRSAAEFLREAHAATASTPELRIGHIEPLVYGVLKALKGKKKKLSVHMADKIQLGWGLSLWLSSIQQVSGNHLQSWKTSSHTLHKNVDEIMKTQWFRNPKHIVVAARIAAIYNGLDRAMPNQLAQKWLAEFDTHVAVARDFNILHDLLVVLPLLDLDPNQRDELAGKWMRRQANLPVPPEQRSKVAYAFNRLHLLSPPAALAFYHANKKMISEIYQQSPWVVVRALMYLKIVMGEKDIEFDKKSLKEMFLDVDSTSKVEAAVAKWLEVSGYVIERGVLDPYASVIEMDIFAYSKSGEPVNIEVDGWHHYVSFENGSKRLRMMDVRRDEILKTLGIKVVRVGSSDLSPENLEMTEQRLRSTLDK